MKLILILIALLTVFLSFIESRPIHDDESELFINYNEQMSPLMFFSDVIDEHPPFIGIDELEEHSPFIDELDELEEHPPYPPFIGEHATFIGNHHRPHPPPKQPKQPNRAYTYFPSPPDITTGVIIFWESKNKTLIFGQFSKGFVEGEEKDYSFKVYKKDQEIYDLKPEGENLDKIFKINPNGSTDSFLFAVNDTLISTRDIIGGDLVIGKPDALIAKDKVQPLSCF